MNQVTVTVRNLSGDIRKTTDVLADMTLGDFKQAAQVLIGLADTPCDLILEKTNKVMRDSDTFQSAGIEPKTVFVLAPHAEGGRA